MALYAFDGTWNEDEEIPTKLTNVVRLRDIYDGPVEYREGVGTRFGSVGRLAGGLFGVGGRSRVEEMYDAARANWTRGDREFDITGFSRGAALAVHFANVLAEQGLRLADGSTVKPAIRFLGVWDIVGSFGIPIDLVIRFQHINLGWTIDRVPATVAHCVHAMSLDERRQAFDVTRLTHGTATQFEELWFKGVHSDVGGGNGNVARNNIAMHWMVSKARAAGLPIDPGHETLLAAQSDPLARISTNKDLLRQPRRVTLPGDAYHPSAVARRLAVGESATFPVRSADPYNWSGLGLERGATYRIEVVGDQRWVDGDISCGPDGWTSDQLPWYSEALVRHLELERRHPAANWFELIGAFEDDDRDLFRIGAATTVRAPRDTQLYAFANDLTNKYGNNHGSLTVTVTRVAD